MDNTSSVDLLFRGASNTLLDSFMQEQIPTLGESGQRSVLHSFPHRLGMTRICMTAWHEITSTAQQGCRVHAVCADSNRPLDGSIELTKTLALGPFRIPRRILGRRRFCALHDSRAAQILESSNYHYNLVHAWPLAALKTIKIAKKLGIPVAMERCNAHTRYAQYAVKAECERIGIKLPRFYEHAPDSRLLDIEEKEYDLADAILCPSEFVAKTFRQQGFSDAKIKRFFYGVDTDLFYPLTGSRDECSPLNIIFVGICAVRKGLHTALVAWLNSEASSHGTFSIVGKFLPAYKEILKPLLAHPSVKILGPRSDVPTLMRQADLLVLPSIEEGFGLVCTEAIASGCVPLVSEACTDLCVHHENSLVHRIGDTDLLSRQISLLHKNRELLNKLRIKGISQRPNLSWSSAGKDLIRAYDEIVSIGRKPN